MYDQRLKEMAPHLPILIDNETCVYCNAPLDVSSRSKEHVIGRRFVPKGKLDRQWNLILWSCKRCNGQKAELENDLSAISMQPDASGAFEEADDVLASESRRKAANAVSRRTGKRVAESVEHITFNAALAPGFGLKFDLTAPPQADSQRVFTLARMHTMAFFYWITFDQSKKRGYFWPGGF
ncbi:HNH endonuclease, partial [Hypericibacter sp.]|uniref:HNH endonuclease n=1 Tax=Hypericibacter sp. TaxID=2705401 RepID=UPI003D6CD0C6